MESFKFWRLCDSITNYMVPTCLENLEKLEMSVNLTAVREMSGILLKVRVLSGKSSLKLFIVSCIFASILDFAELCISFQFRIMRYCIPTPITDNNTTTGTIWLWVTLNTGRSAENHQGNVMELSWNFTYVEFDFGMFVFTVGTAGLHNFFQR